MNRLLNLAVRTVCAASIAAAALTQTVPALSNPIAPPVIAIRTSVPGKIVIPGGTPVNLKLEQNLKSGGSKVGEVVQFQLASDLYTPDRQLVAPAGTLAFGKVLQSSRHGIFGKAGKLQISCDYILAPDGTHIPLRGASVGQSGRNEAVGMAAVVLLVSPVGLLINGRDVNLHVGMPVSMVVDQDTVVTPYLTVVKEASAKAGAADGAGVSPGSSSQETMYTLKDGSVIVGRQKAFDGATYAVMTDGGIRVFKANTVASIAEITVAAPTAPAEAATSTPGTQTASK